MPVSAQIELVLSLMHKIGLRFRCKRRGFLNLRELGIGDLRRIRDGRPRGCCPIPFQPASPPRVAGAGEGFSVHTAQSPQPSPRRSRQTWRMPPLRGAPGRCTIDRLLPGEGVRMASQLHRGGSVAPPSMPTQQEIERVIRLMEDYGVPSPTGHPTRIWPTLSRAPDNSPPRCEHFWSTPELRGGALVALAMLARPRPPATGQVPSGYERADNIFAARALEWFSEWLLQVQIDLRAAGHDDVAAALSGCSWRTVLHAIGALACTPDGLVGAGPDAVDDWLSKLLSRADDRLMALLNEQAHVINLPLRQAPSMRLGDALDPNWHKASEVLARDGKCADTDLAIAALVLYQFDSQTALRLPDPMGGLLGGRAGEVMAQIPLLLQYPCRTVHIVAKMAHRGMMLMPLFAGDAAGAARERHQRRALLASLPFCFRPYRGRGVLPVEVAAAACTHDLAKDRLRHALRIGDMLAAVFCSEFHLRAVDPNDPDHVDLLDAPGLTVVLTTWLASRFRNPADKLARNLGIASWEETRKLLRQFGRTKGTQDDQRRAVIVEMIEKLLRELGFAVLDDGDVTLRNRQLTQPQRKAIYDKIIDLLRDIGLDVLNDEARRAVRDIALDKARQYEHQRDGIADRIVELFLPAGCRTEWDSGSENRCAMCCVRAVPHCVVPD